MSETTQPTSPLKAKAHKPTPASKASSIISLMIVDTGGEWGPNALRAIDPVKGKLRISGILNDPNCWFEHPRDLITAIERIVHISVQSTNIIDNLPSEITDDSSDV